MAMITGYVDKYNNPITTGSRLKFDSDGSYYTADLNSKGEFILIPDDSTRITLRGKYVTIGFQFCSAEVLFGEDKC